jgi:hypothetical protein
MAPCREGLPRVSIAEVFPARTGLGNPRAAEVVRLAVAAVFRPGKTGIRRADCPVLLGAVCGNAFLGRF